MTPERKARILELLSKAAEAVNADCFYLAGSASREAALLITKEVNAIVKANRAALARRA